MKTGTVVKKNHFLVNRKLIDTFLRAPLSRSVCVCQNIAKWGGWYNNMEGRDTQQQLPIAVPFSSGSDLDLRKSSHCTPSEFLVTWISHWNILLLQDNQISIGGHCSRRFVYPVASCGEGVGSVQLTCAFIVIQDCVDLWTRWRQDRTGQDSVLPCISSSEYIWDCKLRRLFNQISSTAAPATKQKFVSVAVQSSRNERGGLACRNFVQLFIRLLVVVTMSCVVSGRMLKVLNSGKEKMGGSGGNKIMIEWRVLVS